MKINNKSSSGNNNKTFKKSTPAQQFEKGQNSFGAKISSVNLELAINNKFKDVPEISTLDFTHYLTLQNCTKPMQTIQKMLSVTYRNLNVIKCLSNSFTFLSNVLKCVSHAI